MKIRKILFSLFSTLACLNVAYATTDPQMYFGAQGGYADTGFSKSTVVGVTDTGVVPITSANIANHVAVGRGYGGYQFNDYLAAEVGYTRWRSTRYSNINDGDVDNGNVSEYAFDLTGKLFLPMATYIHLSPYLKFGINYMDVQTSGGIVNNAANDFGYSWHPLFGIGIGYMVYPATVVDFCWTTITKRNSNVPQIAMFTLGLTYYFGSFTATNNEHNFGGINSDDP